uniref:Uncharacterized protein n=1 Tax=Arundo donax TaxID=35708 RepID=A0A0A9AWM6_ARUDO
MELKIHTPKPRNHVTNQQIHCKFTSNSYQIESQQREKHNTN